MIVSLTVVIRVPCIRRMFCKRSTIFDFFSTNQINSDIKLFGEVFELFHDQPSEIKLYDVSLAMDFE